MSAASRTPSPPGSPEFRPCHVIIRPAAVPDVDAIMVIERQSFADPWSEGSFVALLRDRRAFFGVAERRERGDGSDAVIAGYVVAWFVVDEGEIANLAVRDGDRHLGIGAALLDSALSETRARGVITLVLEVRESNEDALALYRSRGFEEVGRRRAYYRKPVEDALVLRLTTSHP